MFIGWFTTGLDGNVMRCAELCQQYAAWSVAA